MKTILGNKRSHKNILSLLITLIFIINSLFPGTAFVYGMEEDLVIVFHTESKDGILTQREVRSQAADKGIFIGDDVPPIGFSAEFDDTVKGIGNSAFKDCLGLGSVIIPNGVESIGEKTFADCLDLISVDMGNGVGSIGQSAFEGCSALTGINIPDSVTSIGANAFCTCTSLTEIVLPDSLISIGSNAFYKCTSLTEITIPSSVKNIGFAPFRKSGIKIVTLLTSDLELTQYEEFDSDYNCSVFVDYTPSLIGFMDELESVIFAQDSTAIPDYTFSYLSKAVNVYVAKSVTTIGENCELGANTTIYAFAKSYAEEYATDNGIDLITMPTFFLEEMPLYEDTPPDEYQIPFAYMYLPYSFKFASSDGAWMEVVDPSKGLPDGMRIAPVDVVKRQPGEIYGAPTSGSSITYDVKVRATDGSNYPIADEISFTIEIKDKRTQKDLESMFNIGRLTTPMGVYYDIEDIYIVDVYNSKPGGIDIEFDCEFVDFVDLWIDGERQVVDQDYEVSEGSTKVTVFTKTFGKLDEKKDHVLAAEFKKEGKADGEQYIVAENFRINKVDSPNTGGNSTKGTASGGKGSSDKNEVTSPPAVITLNVPEEITPTIAEPSLEPFIDVNTGDWFYDDVMWAYANKLMIGVAPRIFAPYQAVNFAMVSVTLTRMLEIDLSEYESEDSSWFSSACIWMNNKGFFTGIDVLEPEKPIDRGQLSIVLARFVSGVGQDPASGEQDSGVDEQDRNGDGKNTSGGGLGAAGELVDNVGGEGITGAGVNSAGKLDENTGEHEGTPDETNAAGAAQGVDGSESETAGLEQSETGAEQTNVSAEQDITGDYMIISDRDKMTDEEFESFNLLVKLGIIKGKGDGRMDPQGLFIRAELAAILHRVGEFINELHRGFSEQQQIVDTV